MTEQSDQKPSAVSANATNEHAAAPPVTSATHPDVVVTIGATDPVSLDPPPSEVVKLRPQAPQPAEDNAEPTFTGRKADSKSDPAIANPVTPDAGAANVQSMTPNGVVAPNDDLSILLSDAKTVALFGQRAGRLSNNSLQAAIAAVTRKGSPSWGDEETLKLQEALNGAIVAIAPVTLLDLRRGWNPFERSKTRMVKSSLKNALFLVFAGLLIFGAAASTFILNKGSAIVIALETLKQQEPQRRIGQLQRQLLNAQTVTVGATPETILAREAYFNTLDDLRDMDQRLSMYMPASLSFPANYGNVFVAARNEFLGPANPIPVQPPAPSGSNSEDKAPENSSETYVAMNTSCELAKTTGRQDDSAFSRSEIGKMFIQYQADAFNLFCYQGLLYQPSMIPPIEARLSAVNEAIGLYALWILPAVYGALGATIFFMRSVLDPLTPDPPMSKIMLRVALGALAGIVLGWFWSPDNPLGSEIAKIGFSLFATSFIVGFSIDVFFAMLDRFVNLSRDFFTKIGT